MILIIPPIAPSPYTIAPPEGTTSIFSTWSTGIIVVLYPFPSKLFNGTPSSKTIVFEFDVAPEPLKSNVGSLPSICLTTNPGTPLNASATVFAPLFWISSCVTIVTFFAVSNTLVSKFSVDITVSLSLWLAIFSSAIAIIDVPTVNIAANIKVFFIIPSQIFVFFAKQKTLIR